MNLDRRDIAPFLGAMFPSIPANATSDDWHGFLNAATGLDVSLTEENASAFDKWRKALAAKGYATWDITPTQEQAIATRGAALLALEQQRVAASAATQAALAAAAPTVTAADILAKAAP